MYKCSNPAKILRELSDFQNYIHNGTIEHELNQIAKYTRDPEILIACKNASDCLDISIEYTFKGDNKNQISRSLNTLLEHLKHANEKFDKIVDSKCDYNQKWLNSSFQIIEDQLLDLSNFYINMHKTPDIFDNNGIIVRPGDLVAIRIKNQRGREYDHYGVVIATSQGFRIAHFFTGSTINHSKSHKLGFGYIHEIEYTPEWNVKEHLPDSASYYEIGKRIGESRKLQNRLWSLRSYNCEHWAREMVSGQPDCTQRRRRSSSTVTDVENFQ